MSEALFLHPSEDGQKTFQVLFEGLLSDAQQHIFPKNKPWDPSSEGRLHSFLSQESVLPEKGLGTEKAVAEACQQILSGALQVHNPRCLAHLHCPPLIPGILAETLLSFANASMDSWDQSPSATPVEEKIIAWLGELVWGHSPDASGTFTSGATLSNHMGLLLARNHFAQSRLGVSPQLSGLPAESMGKWVVFASEEAHFSIEKSLQQLGLGSQSCWRVATTPAGTMDTDALAIAHSKALSQGLMPFAVVATAGTTDLGAIDPLQKLGAFCEDNGIWFHVDAAYGGGLLLSERLRPLLHGIERADSLALDFHKFFFQPISCGAFLLKNNQHFDSLKFHSPYLNPEEEEGIGRNNLVVKSLQTTRRFDALKIWVSARALGRKTYAHLIETCCDSAKLAFTLLQDFPRLEPLNTPQTANLLFRYCGENHSLSAQEQDALNAQLRDELMQSGMYWIARTQHKGRFVLKLTILNPTTDRSDLKDIFTAVQNLGDRLSHAIRTPEEAMAL